MCGINGILNLSGAGIFEQEVSQMNSALAHRGPDDEGIFSIDGISLGHKRLSIIDLSTDGHQPMNSSNNNLTIVYNGELYNFKELKKELVDYKFQTESDTEVILAAYEKWGKDCLNHFNGMFAFAIWDKTKKELFIARDRLGIKPLYYSYKNGMLVFSSEVRGVLASGLVKRKLNEKVIDDYLRYQTVFAPETIIDELKMLRPGYFLVVNKDGVQNLKWWEMSLKKDKTIENLNYNEVCKNVKMLLRDAVERRLIADVPFGAFLSGGIDSSAIVGLMSEVSSVPINTFSITFDDSEFSEAVYAKQVAEKFKTIHQEIKLDPADFLIELPHALDAMDHPSGDGPNSYIVSKATKKAGITMALSGLGGDELFCGYAIFKQTMELDKKKWMNSIPIGLRKVSANVFRKIKPGVSTEKIAAVISAEKIDFNSFYPLSRLVLLEAQIKLIRNEGYVFSKNKINEEVELVTKSFEDKNHLLSRVSVAEISTYMQNVLLRDTDQMSMASALEVRVPFLDYKLVEYVLNLPDEIKYPSSPKKLLVDAMGDLLPTEIVNRPKMGFTFPWKIWMKHELKSFCEERLNNLGKRKAFNGNGIQQLWNLFLKDDPLVTWSRIWPLVVLSHWLEKNNIEDE